MAPILRGLLVFVLALSVLLLPASRPLETGVRLDPSVLSAGEGASMKQEIDSMIGEMSLKEKVGQMFMVGFQNGEEPAYEINRQIRTLIRKEKAGGVILFDRNIHSPSGVGRLTNQLQQLALLDSSRIPLLISIDQEGGKVARMREGVTQFPGAMALGATEDPRLSYRVGRVTGSELRAMGIHMNLAPVLDVNNNPSNPIIGVRSFSSNPDQVARMGLAQIRGYHDGQVLTAVKHFPGHGDTSVDTHVNLPAIPHSLERLNQVELVPFKRVLDQTDAVMSAHITFPKLVETPGLPGTLSKKVLTGLLRERLGFAGVIMTDDLEMGAIVEHFGPEEAAVRAVKAGADILLVSHNLDHQQASMAAVRQAVKKGEISEERIDQSLRRILRLKLKRTGGVSIAGKPLVPVSQVKERVGTKEHAAVARRVAQEALTLVQDREQRVPLDRKQVEDVLLISPEGTEKLGRSLTSRGFSVREVAFDSDAREVGEVIAEARQADVVIIGTQADTPAQTRLIRTLEARGIPVIALGLDTPYEVSTLPDQTTYLALYSTGELSLEAAADALAGRLTPRGDLPVDIPGAHDRGSEEEQ
ncbi:beta-N-acetylhexosaminidase [Melghirimyces thermohalophilus]|uniref:beta-N-acetylhexosaminidase n=1 Tax=Melghirimyces thermohalophilus TaxID=1236220 RepID=UPI0015A3639B|nr:beta-N-acetylhexosaminidase [Melghirimyces thermohalophilus]